MLLAIWFAQKHRHLLENVQLQMGDGNRLFKTAMARLCCRHQIWFLTRTRWYQNYSQELEECRGQIGSLLEFSLDEWIVWPYLRIWRMCLIQACKETFGVPYQLSSAKLGARLRRIRNKRQPSNRPKHVQPQIRNGHRFYLSKVAQPRKDILYNFHPELDSDIKITHNSARVASGSLGFGGKWWISYFWNIIWSETNLNQSFYI